MSLLAELVALVAPPVCVACRAPLAGGRERLCVSCTRALPWLRGRVCARCGLPSHRGGRCPAAAAAFPRAWAPLAYDGPARALVGALKFRSALPVADLMAAQMAANLPPELRTPPAAVVPVPAHAGRRRRRGFDPAGTLAAALARRLDRPLVACLRRTDRAARQVGASRGARRRAGRLEIVARGIPPPPLALLVDDVHTTGATLDAAARALAGAGTEIVAAITYARTL
jgi:predicted amidophosphoribosyltransferase